MVTLIHNIKFKVTFTINRNRITRKRGRLVKVKYAQLYQDINIEPTLLKFFELGQKFIFEQFESDLKLLVIL